MAGHGHISDSNFPSTMDFQDLLEMSNSIPEECASTLPTANAQPVLPSNRCNSVPDREIKYEDPLTHKIEKRIFELQKGTLIDTNALSDVTFIVGEEKCEIKAHKMILALSSPVFTAMFYGDLASKPQMQQQSSSGNNSDNAVTVIEVPDCAPRSFQFLLQFMYKGDEPSLTVDDALSLLYTSRKYAVRGLEDKCSVVLSSSITADNVFDILYAATFYGVSGLGLKCWEYMEENPVDVLNSHLEFLSHETMQSVLKNDKLNANEVELFKAVVKWGEILCHKLKLESTPENIRKVCEAELKLIRFPVMTGAEFADHVVPTKILTVDQVAKIFTLMNASDEKKGEMHDLLSLEFNDQKRVPKLEIVKANSDSSAPPVFTFIAQQTDRSQPANQAGSVDDTNRALVMTGHGSANTENILALLGVDGLVAVPVPLPGTIPSVTSAPGERNRSRQRPRRNRRRSVGNNIEPEVPRPAAVPQPRQ